MTSEATTAGALTSQLTSSTTTNTFTLSTTTATSGDYWSLPFVYVCFAFGAAILVVLVALIICFVIRQRRRRRDIATARQRLQHLQQYHMKGNPVGNGSVSGAVAEHEQPSAGSPAASQQSTLTTTSYIAAHNLPPDGATISGRDRQREDSYINSQFQRRSHLNGDVFYLSGRANTARCTTAHNDLADHTLTTFKYYTYDRDYFRERHKSSCLRDCNLRHSME